MRIRWSAPPVPTTAPTILMTAALVLAPGPLTAQDAPPAGAAAEPELRRYAVDRDASRLWIHVDKGGLLSFLGHEHAVVPGEWTADLCLDRPVPEGAGGSVRVETASLVIDSDSARALAGLDDGPDAEDREEIQRKMLGAGYLAAERHPTVGLEVRAAGPQENDVVPVRGTLRARGTVTPLSFPLEVTWAGEGRVALSGTATVRQTELGMEPESVAGVVKVSDQVELHVHLVGVETSEACAGRARAPGLSSLRRPSRSGWGSSAGTRPRSGS